MAAVEEMTIEQAVRTLNAHSHRGRSDWRWSVSHGEVGIANHETTPIHPTDAILIATYYWHRLNQETDMSEGSRYAAGGFESRFVVTRTDGKPCRPEARYFVLDISGADPHALAALTGYAASVAGDNPQLAAALLAVRPGSVPPELAQHADAK